MAAMMLRWALPLALLTVGSRAAILRGGVSPLDKVISLLSDMEVKIIAEGQSAQKTYEEYSEWCEDRAKNLDYDIKSGKADIDSLKAGIDKAAGAITTLSSTIEETSGGIAANEADLKAATTIRAKELADFTVAEKELVEVVDALDRAIGILEREMRKHSAAMLQLQKAGSVLEALRVMVDAAMIGSQDANTLTALVQRSKQEDEDDSMGAPDAAAYEGHSGSIVETLEGLLDKAKEQLDGARKKETNAKHNFEMLKQSLEDEIKFGNADLNAAKKNLAAETEAKAQATGDLAQTTKTLQADLSTKSTLKSDCTIKASDFEAAVKSRAEELKAIATAKTALKDLTGNAGALTYSFRQASFLQLDLDQGGRTITGGESTIQTSADLANFEAVRYVRNLAREQHSEELMQLARRMSAAMRYGTVGGQDPFAKVKGLLSDMITKLVDAAATETSHKAYCDKELGDTAQTKLEKGYEVDKLTTKIDSMSAQSAKLKEQVTELMKALADLASSLSEMTKLRQDEHAEFTNNKPEIEQGLEGVKLGLKVLREYYAKEDVAHETASGSANSIIGLLEVVESDFSKLLAEMVATEKGSDLKYEAEAYLIKVEQTSKEQDVKYKTEEYKKLDQAVAEAKSDLEGVQTELSAILDYKAHIQEICTTKAESYGDRKARREAEIAGLKEALSILEGEAVLLQGERRSKGFLRAAAPEKAAR